MKDQTMPDPSYLKVLKLLWKHGDMRAAELAQLLRLETNWHRNTSYPVINCTIKARYLQRIELCFFCHARLTQEEVRVLGRRQLLETLYDGDVQALIASLEEDRK